MNIFRLNTRSLFNRNRHLSVQGKQAMAAFIFNSVCMKILIIEDEPEMQDLIKKSLENENFVVESASDYHTGLDKIVAYDYDCILLDIMLPGGSGLDLLQELKNFNKSDSVIVISAKDSLDDKIRGLNLGADDYLAKPFHIAELHARIKSVIRRSMAAGKNYLELENLKIDMDERLVTVDDRPLILNRKELDILIYFIVNKNRLLSKSAIAENVWGDRIDEADQFDFIYSQIKNLRKKLRDHGANFEINAVYGMGYKLVIP
jgi:DNA-binding response OmpR family regulator